MKLSKKAELDDSFRNLEIGLHSLKAVSFNVILMLSVLVCVCASMCVCVSLYAHCIYDNHFSVTYFLVVFFTSFCFCGSSFLVELFSVAVGLFDGFLDLCSFILSVFAAELDL